MNEILYIESSASLKEKIARYDIIIAALCAQSTIAAAGSDISEYEINDGQVKIKTIYRSVTAISDAILKFEALRGRALNKLNGAVLILRPVRGLR